MVFGGQNRHGGCAHALTMNRYSVAQQELCRCVPWLDWSDAQYAVHSVDRAEPRNRGGLRPDQAYVERQGSFMQCFPTKLTLTPDLGDRVLHQLEAPATHTELDVVSPNPVPDAHPPWQQSRKTQPGRSLMLPQRPLGNTGIDTGLIALGLVKLGRATGVKYPTPVQIPTDQEAQQLLLAAAELGVNLLDTAPAYGDSETRLGQLLSSRFGLRRQDWLLCTKVGESFDGQTSSYDFSSQATQASVERSLTHLNTDYLDVVLIHSDGRDQEILNTFGTLETLQALKQAGKIRAVGMSHKTVEGAELAIEQGADVIMATLNPGHQTERAIIAEAHVRGVGVLIKKALTSGHGTPADLAWVAAQPGVSSIVVGTSNPTHLTQNADLLC